MGPSSGTTGLRSITTTVHAPAAVNISRSSSVFLYLAWPPRVPPVARPRVLSRTCLGRLVHEARRGSERSQIVLSAIPPPTSLQDIRAGQQAPFLHAGHQLVETGTQEMKEGGLRRETLLSTHDYTCPN